MKLDRRTSLFGTFAVAIASAAACSSFSGQSSAPNADASTTNDGGAKSDANLADNDGEATSVDGGTTVGSCDNQSGAREFAGLYVFGGEGMNADASYTEPQDVLRAGIHCDGSLGNWVTVGTYPSSNSNFVGSGHPAPSGGAAGSRILMLGGDTALGGPPFSTTLFEWTVSSDGGLSTPAMSVGSPLANVWRALSTVSGSTLVVAGGEGPSPDGGTQVESAVSLWPIANTGAVVSAMPLPIPTSRSGAAADGNDIYVFAGGTILYGALESGGISAWTVAGNYGSSDDNAAVIGADGLIFRVGGYNAPTSVTIFTIDSTAKTVTPSTSVQIGAPSATSCLAVANHMLYVIGSTYAPNNGVASAPIVAGGLGAFVEQQPLPEPRWSCVAVVVPLQ